MLSTIRRHRLMVMATATVPGGEHGMAARLVTPYRAVIVPPIKAPAEAIGGPGMAVRPATRSRVAFVSPIAPIKF